jgi:SHS2 domain-containing protein
MPFEEISHTADWALHVWAANLDQLFEESARGMNTLSGTRLEESPQVERALSLSAADAESLLVAFLSELVYIGEHEHLGFDEIEVKIERAETKSCSLSAALHGARIMSQNKGIKAVTYHNLQIRQTGRGHEVEIVFDV